MTARKPPRSKPSAGVRRPAQRAPAKTAAINGVKKLLAPYGDPYVTSDGRVIPPADQDRDAHPTQLKSKYKTYRPTKRRTIKEMPATSAVMKGIAVIFVYTVMGLADREIAELLNLDVSQVKQVRTNPGYLETFDIISSEFVNVQSRLLTARIAAYADEALTNVHEIAANGKKENNVLRANIDLLDRAGVRPKDQETRANAAANELRIILVDGDRDANVEIGSVDYR